MALRKVFFAACLVLSLLCLAAGYGVAGQWPGVGMAIITGLAWLLARKYSDSGLPLICLLASVGMAVVGRLTGVPPLLMICGSGMALAVWDLVLLDAALESNSSGEQTRQYEKRHLQSLLLAVGFGLCAAFLGRLLTLQVPFVLLVLFVVLTVFGLDRVWGYIEKMVYR
jgi:hypothetical protein